MPVFHMERFELWVVTRYDDIVRVMKDPTTFSSSESLSVDTGVAPEVPPAETDMRTAERYPPGLFLQIARYEGRVALEPLLARLPIHTSFRVSSSSIILIFSCTLSSESNSHRIRLSDADRPGVISAGYDGAVVCSTALGHLGVGN